MILQIRRAGIRGKPIKLSLFRPDCSLTRQAPPSLLREAVPALKRKSRGASLIFHGAQQRLTERRNGKNLGYRAVFGKFIAQGNLILVIFALMRLHDLHREVARRHAGKTQGGKQIARFNKNIDQIQILDAGSLRAVRNSEHHGVLLVALHTDSGHVAVGPRVGHGRK